MKREEIQLLNLKDLKTGRDTGRLWPHYKERKALSANTLTKILREIEYGEIPAYILIKAAERGKNFHEIVQGFVQTGKYPAFVDLIEKKTLSILDKKVHETISFLKKSKKLELGSFLGSEKLHYVFYKGELLATYVDLEFHDYIVELKSNSAKVNKLTFGQDKVCLDSFDKLFNSPFALLIFEVQLLIQYLCTGKSIYLL
jgi:hypothetical protein